MMRPKVLLIPSLDALRAEAQQIPLIGAQSPCREALCTLFLALEKVSIEQPKVPLSKLLDAQQIEYLEFRQALCEAYHNENINQFQALEAAVQAISTRYIAQEAGVAVALAQARQVLLVEVRR